MLGSRSSVYTQVRALRRFSRREAIWRRDYYDSFTCELIPSGGAHMKSFKWSTIYRVAVMMLLLSCLSGAREAQAQKLKADEIIAKHLEAIGGTETLQSVSTRVSKGTVVVTFKEPGTGQLGGRGGLASEGPKSMMAMAVDNATNYPHERIGYDGKEVTGVEVHPGSRSSLGDFLLTHQAI